MQDNLTIALIQTPLHWENPKKNRRMFQERILGLDSTVDLIVLPEMFTTGFTMHPYKIAGEEGENTRKWMRKMAQSTGSALVGSVATKIGNTYYNRLYFVPPDNEIVTYDKRHCFTLAGEDKVYTAGHERQVVMYRDFRICPLICYDLRFPVWSRNTEEYDVLLYVANWPKTRIAAWDALLRARAIENMAYCVGVNRVGKDDSGYEYNGHSAVYDVLGEKLAFSEIEEVLYVTLSKTEIRSHRDKLGFLKDRDSFNLIE